MTREEAITQYIMPALKRTWRDDTCIEIISAIEQDPCWDAISRQAVLDAIMANCIWENEYNLTSSSIKKAVESLPPVNPQEPKSEWEHDHEILKAYSNGANEVLDKIVDEIQEYKSRKILEFGVKDLEKGKETALDYVLAIIDQCRPESEDKE